MDVKSNQNKYTILSKTGENVENIQESIRVLNHLAK